MALDRETTLRMTGGLDPMDAPIPGESLTASPASPAPHERPPEHVTEESAIEDLFLRMIEEDTLDELLDLMREDVPVESIAQTLLFEGFRQGKFTPDLMLLLIEPTIYILLWLAEYAGIDPVIDPESDEEDIATDLSGVEIAAKEETGPEVDAKSLLASLPEEIVLKSGQRVSRNSASLLDTVPTTEEELDEEVL